MQNHDCNTSYNILNNISKGEFMKKIEETINYEYINMELVNKILKLLKK